MTNLRRRRYYFFLPSFLLPFFLADVYANRRVPLALQENPLLWGECLSGALYWNDFVHLAQTAGFPDPRLVEDAPVTIENAAVQAMVRDSGHGNIEFYSATYRLMKELDDGNGNDHSGLEPACEDYGQAVIYRGSIPRAPSTWMLDKGHVFETGKIHAVCGNTWNMLSGSATMKDHFDFVGNFDTHYGIFEGCGTSMPYSSRSSAGVGAAAAAGAAAGGGKGSAASCC
jgi:arsenite methyltransferase